MEREFQSNALDVLGNFQVMVAATLQIEFPIYQLTIDTANFVITNTVDLFGIEDGSSNSYYSGIMRFTTNDGFTWYAQNGNLGKVSTTPSISGPPFGSLSASSPANAYATQLINFGDRYQLIFSIWQIPHIQSFTYTTFTLHSINPVGHYTLDGGNFADYPGGFDLTLV